MRHLVSFIPNDFRNDLRNLWCFVVKNLKSCLNLYSISVIHVNVVVVVVVYKFVHYDCTFSLHWCHYHFSLLNFFRNCPIDLKEAVSSVIFASPRCSDIPELVDVKKQITSKYGKEFVSAAIELRPDCGVNRMASFCTCL